MPALAADSRPRRFGNNISASHRVAAGPGQHLILVTSFKSNPGAKPHRSDTPSPFPPLKSAPAPGRRPGVKSLLMMDVVTRVLCCCERCRGSFRVHARKRPSRPANAEIRHGYGYRLAVTTPTAHRCFFIAVGGLWSYRGKGWIGETYWLCCRLRRASAPIGISRICHNRWRLYAPVAHQSR